MTLWFGADTFVVDLGDGVHHGPFTTVDFIRSIEQARLAVNATKEVQKVELQSGQAPSS